MSEFIGFVYKIINTKIEDFYIGSTRNTVRRFTDHKRNCRLEKNRNYNIPFYCHLREIGIENTSLYILETINSINKIELLKRERYWIEELKPSLNRCIPYRTEEENKSRVKKWHTENKEHIKEYKAELYKKNIIQEKEKSKIYYDLHKQEAIERVKQSRANSEIIICECGSSVKKVVLYAHIKTQKHKKYMSTLST